MNIYQKLVEVRKSVPYLQKENSGFQYKYVSSSQVLASLKNKMDEVGLILIPSIESSKVTTDIFEKPDAKGNVKRNVDYFTELYMKMTWVNAENPEEKVECNWYGQGCDTAGEKGVGKALTYAEKYFMLKFFNIPTDKDDPDSFQSKFEEENPKIDKIKIETLRAMIKKTNSTEKSMLDYYNVKKIEDITVLLFMEIMTALEKKEKKLLEEKAKQEKLKEGA